MTALPLEQITKASEAFTDVAPVSQVRRVPVEGPGGQRGSRWAREMLRSLLHAILAAAAVSWNVRGYLDRIDSRIEAQGARQAEMERRLDAMDHQIERLTQRLDDDLQRRNP